MKKTKAVWMLGVFAIVAALMLVTGCTNLPATQSTLGGQQIIVQQPTGGATNNCPTTGLTDVDIDVVNALIS